MKISNVEICKLAVGFTDNTDFKKALDDLDIGRTTAEEKKEISVGDVIEIIGNLAWSQQSDRDSKKEAQEEYERYYKSDEWKEELKKAEDDFKKDLLSESEL